MSVLQFPHKLTLEPPQVQLNELRKMSSRELLCALAMKHPDVRFTADELARAKGGNIKAEATADNEWRIVAKPATVTGAPERTPNG